MISLDAMDYYEWIKDDDRVAGMLAWNWGGCAGCNGSRWTPPHTCCMDEIGTKDMPTASKVWLTIGQKLIDN